MAQLNEAQKAFLAEPNFAVVATVGPDGMPQTSVVWIDTDGEHVVSNTTGARAKTRNLRANPKVGVTVLDRDDGYRFLEVTGTAVLDEEGASEHIEFLSHKYDGRPLTGPPGRVIVRVTPQRIEDHHVTVRLTSR